MIGVLRAAGAHVIWRCHIGRDVPNAYTDEGWAFLRNDVLQADGVIFSRRTFVPDWIPADRVHLIAPSLDPFSPKNQELSPTTVRLILLRAGLLRGTAVDDVLLSTAIRPDGSTALEQTSTETPRVLGLRTIPQ